MEYGTPFLSFFAFSTQRMATATSVAVEFLKQKQAVPLLQELAAFLARPVAADHGLHGCIQQEKAGKFTPLMSTHIFCCYVKVGPENLRRAIRATDGLMCRVAGGGHASAASVELEPWVLATERAAHFLQTVEFLWPWLATETDLALADFLRANLIAIQTAAPGQLLLQWWSELFLTGLEWLLEREVDVTEADEEGVKGVFDTGQKLLRGLRRGAAAGV